MKALLPIFASGTCCSGMIMTRADESLLKDVLYFSHLEIIVAIVRLSKVTRKDQKKSTVIFEFTVSGSN